MVVEVEVALAFLRAGPPRVERELLAGAGGGGGGLGGGWLGGSLKEPEAPLPRVCTNPPLLTAVRRYFRIQGAR